ncbi:MAG: ADP-ribosyltransferase, partial [Eubacteriales bacterium]|nr:ADP-ribosyltransferase [Eubacteriales bacterium]
ISTTQNIHGGDLDLYKYVGDGLGMELDNYSLQEDMLFYNGTVSISNITGAGSTIKDMMASVRRTYSNSLSISTTLDASVALSFADQTQPYATIREIYIDANAERGAYIASLSAFPDETEFLIDEDHEYIVLDVGVRQITAEHLYFDQEPVTKVVRYVKLLMTK